MSHKPPTEDQAPAAGNTGPDKKAYFRWDERHHQPHTDLTKRQKLWASRHDLIPYLRMAASVALGAPRVWAAYRRLELEPPSWRAYDRSALGLSITPTEETLPLLLRRLEVVQPGTVLVRIPRWQPELTARYRWLWQELRGRGVGLVFALLQDRQAVMEPALWTEFLRQVAGELAEFNPAFELGHALNRKKWGIWHPVEYLRLLDASAPVVTETPGCRWLGPAVIDFEHYFTYFILNAHRPFDFDGVSSLLYVDRRGSPEQVQYGRFDTWRKIALLRATVQAAAHPEVPLYLTEFNWPLKGAGKHSPAGSDVQTDLASQAKYCVVYYLTAFAAPQVALASWWQVMARGYGLLDEDGSTRPAWQALAELHRRLEQTRDLRKLHGSTSDGPVANAQGFHLRGAASETLLLYAASQPFHLTLPAGVEVRGLLGEQISSNMLKVEIGFFPVYLEGDTQHITSVLEQMVSAGLLSMA